MDNTNVAVSIISKAREIASQSDNDFGDALVEVLSELLYDIEELLPAYRNIDKDVMQQDTFRDGFMENVRLFLNVPNK